MVQLKFHIELDYEVFSPSHFIFNMGAATTPVQKVLEERVAVNGSLKPLEIICEPPYGNRIFRLNADSGPLRISYEAKVQIDHILVDPTNISESPVAQIPPDVLPYLMASRYCPSDQFVQMAHEQFGNVIPGYDRVETIRRWVKERTQFFVGCSTPSTTAMETYSEKRGVCRDFSHLLITLCRALNIPARFVTGLDYGADPGLGPPDFHAYTEVWLGERWYLFDATGISPLTGLVRLATGKDAADVSFCTSFGSVRSGMPKVAIQAIKDDSAGIVLPYETPFAVSTADLYSLPNFSGA